MIVRRLPDWVNDENLELYHHGIKGQKWGVRRYQNADGTLTAAGRRRYEKNEAKREKRRNIALNSNDRKKVAKYSRYLTDEELSKKVDRFKNEDYIRQKPVKQLSEGKKFALKMLEKTITATLIATAAYVGYKYAKHALLRSGVLNVAMDSLNNLKAKGETVAKASKTVNKAVNDAVKTTKDVASNVNKIAGNPNELRARLVAQNAIKNGYSEDAAKKIYKMVLKRG